MSDDANTTQLDNNETTFVGWWQPLLFGAMAGGIAWGIRGQYGHETGAMMAGFTVSLTLIYLLCRNANAHQMIRAAAWCTVAMGIGGTMTYGQTLGLTQNGANLGNWGSLGWGLLGTAVKGSIWIAFAGLFLGLGLGGKRYGVGELALVLLVALGASFLGQWLLNSPYVPKTDTLPRLYFSSHPFWVADPASWDPVKEKPRHETWGALLFALLILVSYVRFIKKDRLAFRMALWGLLGGALGFPLGQCIQASNAWNPAFWNFLGGLKPYINWWNMMETTFGATMGGTLGLGLWLNRSKIQLNDVEPKYIPVALEWSLLALHLILLMFPFLQYFTEAPESLKVIVAVEHFYDFGFVMAMLPLAVIAGSRWFPAMMMLPVLLLPIASKTLYELAYKHDHIADGPGWIFYFIFPMGLAIAGAICFKLMADRKMQAWPITGLALMIGGWIIMLLNHAFFNFPWFWREWTARTPNDLIFWVCILSLTTMVVLHAIRRCETSD